MGTSNERHIEQHPGGGWAVRKPHAERVSSRHETQAQAQTRATEILSHGGGGEAVTHRRDGSIRRSDTVYPAVVDWSLLSPHGHVLFFIALCPESTVKDIARAIGHSERQMWSIIQALRRSGVLRVRKNGRRHHYSVDLDAPLLHPTIVGLTLRPVVGPLAQHARREDTDICQETNPRANF